MCYSVESSLKTTALSLFAIIYLFQSESPYFKWIGLSLIGWCSMQFAELLLWLTEPQHGCTKWNVIFSVTLIPLALMMQPLGSLFGSFFVIPWSESSLFRKWFTVIFCAIAIGSVAYVQFIQQEQLCTFVTPKGHLFWGKTKKPIQNEPAYVLSQALWFLFIMIPILIFWDKSLPFLLIAAPLFGFLYGHYKTDSRGSIWCFYTSFSSIVASILLFLKNHKIYNAF